MEGEIRLIDSKTGKELLPDPADGYTSLREYCMDNPDKIKTFTFHGKDLFKKKRSK